MARAVPLRSSGAGVSAARRWAAAIAVLAFLAVPTWAQRADRPVVSVGDRWQFVAYFTVYSTTPNRTWVVESVSPAGIEGTENGEPLRLTPDLNVLESPRARDATPGLLRFPLEVGKRWTYASDYEFKDNGTKVRSSNHVQVVAFEKVRVVAGEFDAFRIETRGKFRGRSKAGGHVIGEWVGFFWYAPAARAIVKSIQRSPYRGTSTVELVAFALQP
jgi:hypothetical protein